MTRERERGRKKQRLTFTQSDAGSTAFGFLNAVKEKALINQRRVKKTLTAA